MKRGFLLSGSKPYKSLASESGVAIIAPDKPRGTFKIPVIPIMEDIGEIGPLLPGENHCVGITHFQFQDHTPFSSSTPVPRRRLKPFQDSLPLIGLLSGCIIALVMRRVLERGF